MPTGYSYCIEKGATLEQYLWRCARGMGAFIMQREDPLDASPPDDVDPVDVARLDAEIADLRRKVVTLRDMTPSAVTAACEGAFAEREREWHVGERARLALVMKLDTMTAAANAWKPPSADHEGLKRFMLEQITTGYSYEMTPRDKPKRQTPDEWLTEQIEHATRSLSNAIRRRGEDIARSKERNAWVKALRESVPYAPWKETP